MPGKPFFRIYLDLTHLTLYPGFSSGFPKGSGLPCLDLSRKRKAGMNRRRSRPPEVRR